MNKHGKRGLGAGKSRQRPKLIDPPRIPCPHGCRITFAHEGGMIKHCKGFHGQEIEVKNG